MIERGNGNERGQNTETILSCDAVETIYQGARENLIAHGSLDYLFTPVDATLHLGAYDS